jgi:hypothetical protein
MPEVASKRGVETDGEAGMDPKPSPACDVAGTGEDAKLAGLPVQYDMPLGVAKSMRFVGQNFQCCFDWLTRN